MTDPDRRFVLTLFFGGLAAVFYYFGMKEPAAAFIGLTGVVGGIYAYSHGWIA